jgi:hypothetical protein
MRNPARLTGGHHRMKGLGVLALLVLGGGCSHHASSAAKHEIGPLTSTTEASDASGAHRSDVVDIQVGAVPESPVMDYSLEHAHWESVLAHLPDELPKPRAATCETGPRLTIKLRGGRELNYVCKLPPGIGETRTFIISLG